MIWISAGVIFCNMDRRLCLVWLPDYCRAKGPWRLEKGQTFKLRYRVALHAGDPKEAALDGVYEQWIKG